MGLFCLVVEVHFKWYRYFNMGQVATYPKQQQWASITWRKGWGGVVGQKGAVQINNVHKVSL